MLRLDTEVMTRTHTCTGSSTHTGTHTHTQILKVISKSDYPEDSWQSIEERRRWNNKQGGCYSGHLGYFVPSETRKLGCGFSWPSNGIGSPNNIGGHFIRVLFSFLCRHQSLVKMRLEIQYINTKYKNGHLLLWFWFVCLNFVRSSQFSSLSFV